MKRLYTFIVESIVKVFHHHHLDLRELTFQSIGKKLKYLIFEGI